MRLKYELELKYIYLRERSYLKFNLFTKEFLNRSVFSFGLVWLAFLKL